MNALPRGSRSLFSKEQIQARVAVLAAEISSAYAGQTYCLLALMNGAIFFSADLLRSLKVEPNLICLRVNSYDHAMSRGTVEGLDELNTLAEFRNRPVLVVDDILETGCTLRAVLGRLRDLGAGQIKTCVLLDKRVNRPVPLEADWVGFTIGPEFVVGYGLDYAGRYRLLPGIWELGGGVGAMQFA